LVALDDCPREQQIAVVAMTNARRELARQSNLIDQVEEQFGDELRSGKGRGLAGFGNDDGDRSHVDGCPLKLDSSTGFVRR
jgi:hypothetical protein